MLLSADRLTRASVALLITLGALTASWAQAADLLHVLGIVTAIDVKHIEVKTARGPVVSVLLDKQVKFKNKINSKSVAPPEVGDRVIIEATKDKQKVTATVVHYSPMRNPSITR
ncbi:MAG: hypothetical protein AB7L09_07705 [Nitrospira sp.]